MEEDRKGNSDSISKKEGQVATKMWNSFDYSYYEKNKRRMLNPHDLAENFRNDI
jgi:hypothetical protein